MLSDKEQKKAFKKIASKDPDKFYPIKTIKKYGFTRKQCEKCGNYFWSTDTTPICGEPTCNAGFQVVENNPSKLNLSYIDVWKKIVEILEPRGYKPIKRYPVVARWNPTTEFTIASIAAFQPYVVTGEVPPPAKKLVIPQMSLRFVDIENVGITGSHLTAFVMIGQHQFVEENDWDQEQAFQDIYDFLTIGVGLDKTEFKIHEDAWAGGGSFGPCLEFFSRGIELFNQVYTMFEQHPKGNRPLKLKVLDMGMGMERVAWFSQGKTNIYEATFPEVLSKIKKITKVTVDHSLYSRFSQFSAYLNIDEVEDIDAAWGQVAEKLTTTTQELRETILPMTAIYSIAEHCRALLFAINDGKLPSNVGGGYNLRVIFRRAIGFIDKFNWDIDMGEVCRWHAEELYDLFPEVSENLDEVCEVLNVEKKRFYATKQEADKIVKKLIKQQAITTEKLIELYDSNGINPEIIQKAAAKYGKEVKIPDDFYIQVMARHEKTEQSHATYKDVQIEVEHLPETKLLYFDNYLDLSNDGKVLKIAQIDYLIKDEEKDNEKDDDEENQEKIKVWGVILDQSIAYPTSGGQMHDTGHINQTKFIDVLKVGKMVVHICDKKPEFSEGDEVVVKIDEKRRIQLTQNHSGTHLVNAAARTLLGNHINQAGAKKTMQKAHLDITHYDSLTDEQLDAIEKIANEFVIQNTHSNNRFMSRAEAEAQFGMRLYQGGAIPGNLLRVVEVPGVEVEACGGTHVNNTGEIGKIWILKGQKIQDGIVRLTFTAGLATERIEEKYNRIKLKLAEILETNPNQILLRGQELIAKWKALRKTKNSGVYTEDMLKLTQTEDDPPKVLREFKNQFKTPIKELVPKFQKLKDEWKSMTSEVKMIAQIISDENQKNLIDEADQINGAKFIGKFYENMGNKVLTNLGRNLLEKEKNLILFFLGSNQNGLLFISMRGEMLQNYNLSVITKNFLSEVKGKGGGKPALTQGLIPNVNMPEKELIPIFKKYLNQ